MLKEKKQSFFFPSGHDELLVQEIIACDLRGNLIKQLLDCLLFLLHLLRRTLAIVFCHMVKFLPLFQYRLLQVLVWIEKRKEFLIMSDFMYPAELFYQYP